MWKDPCTNLPMDKQHCEVMVIDNKDNFKKIRYAQYTPGYMHVKSFDDFTFWGDSRDSDFTVIAWREV